MLLNQTLEHFSKYFLPKYMKYVLNKCNVLNACYKVLTTSKRPDTVLYEQFPAMWSKLPWVDQVKDTLDYWVKYNIVSMRGWESRFAGFQKLFEAKKIRGETMLCLEEEIDSDLVSDKVVKLLKTYNIINYSL